MSYLNVAEVETALKVAAGPANASFTKLITLPHLTWEGRTCRAIRVHRGATAGGGVYLLGGVHAREWGSPDILINFVQLLTDAYRTGTGISQGGRPRSVSAWVVSPQHGDLVTQHQDLDVLCCVGPGEQRQQLSTRARIRYASRKAAAGDHAAWAVDGDCEVGLLTLDALVRGCATVLGAHRGSGRRLGSAVSSSPAPPARTRVWQRCLALAATPSCLRGHT